MKRPPPPPTPGVGRWMLRFILLGGGVAWLMHLVFAYVIAEFGVLSGLVDLRWAGLDAVSWMLLALSAAMLALAATATVLAYGLRRGDTGEREWEPGATERFCARFGFATNLAFLLIIAVQTIPVFYFLRLS